MAERTRRHQEWLDYFRILVARYQDNPLYPTVASVTWQTMDVIDDAADVDAFKHTIWTSTLLVEHAKALIRDHETQRGAIHAELDEPVKAYGSRTILGGLDAIVDLPSLNEMVAGVRSQVGRALELDAFVDQVGADFAALEEIEVLETAEVPERWRAELDAEAAALVVEGTRQWYQEVMAAARAVWDGWSLDEREVWAARHRRRIPFPDAVVERRLGQHRRYRGVPQRPETEPV
jgi:hypothetical protein